MYTRGWAISATPNRLHWPKLKKSLFSIHHQHHSCRVGPNDKTRQKFVKLIDPTYVFSSLTNFGYEVHTMTGNGNYVNLLKLVLKNSWNHFRRNQFWWVPFWNFVQHSDNYYIEASIVKIYGFCPKQILHMCIAVLCYVPDKNIFKFTKQKKI